MGRISRESIEEVRRANDLVEVVGGYIPLQKRGGAFWACCPFHDEKSPSFQVHPVRQTYKCFGCGEFGGVIDFILKYERLDFVEAVEKLASRAAIQIKYERGGPTQAERSLRARALDILTWAQRGFAGNLKRTPEAMQYLEDRGLGGDVAERWGIGYAPDAWTRLTDAARKHFRDDEALLATGLSRQGDRGWYDFFRARVTFPIRDAQQRIVGFGARVLDPDAKTQKYVNSAEGLLFQKSKLLYGIDKLAQSEMLKQAGRVLLMEGYTDVIAAHEAGFDNAVAPLGTALTRDQLSLLRRYNAGVTLVLDGDDAGLAAAERAAGVALEVGVDARVAVIDGAKDPFDLLRTKGPAAMQEILEKAKDAFDFKLEQLGRRHDLSRPLEAENALKELAQTLASVESDSLREMLVRKASGVLKVREQAVMKPVGEARARAAARSTAGSPEGSGGTIELPADPRIAYERTILTRLFEHQPVLHSASQLLEPAAFSTPGLQALFREMCNQWDEYGELVPGALVAQLDAAGRAELERVLEFTTKDANEGASELPVNLSVASPSGNATGKGQRDDGEEEQKLIQEIQRMASHAAAGPGATDLAALRQKHGRNRA